MQNSYPNPFRSQNLEHPIDQTEIFEEVRETLEPFLSETLEPFLTDRFYLIHHFVDELGNLKFRFRIIEILQNKAIDLYFYLENKFNEKRKLKPLKFVVKIIYKLASIHLKKLNTIKDYNQTLRYLEYPLHPVTDRNGFEIQVLTEEIIENTLEEIEDGYEYIYEYCSRKFPETIDLWKEHAFYQPSDFPFLLHDKLLKKAYFVIRRTYRLLKRNSVITENWALTGKKRIPRKNSFNTVRWALTGDFKTRILQIMVPRHEFTKICRAAFLRILESFVVSTITILTVRYIALHYKKYYKKVEPLVERIIDESGVRNEEGIRGAIQFWLMVYEDRQYGERVLVHKVRQWKAKIINSIFILKYRIVKRIVSKTSI